MGGGVAKSRPGWERRNLRVRRRGDGRAAASYNARAECRLGWHSGYDGMKIG